MTNFRDTQLNPSGTPMSDAQLAEREALLSSAEAAGQREDARNAARAAGPPAATRPLLGRPLVLNEATGELTDALDGAEVTEPGMRPTSLPRDDRGAKLAGVDAEVARHRADNDEHAVFAIPSADSAETDRLFGRHTH